MTNLSQRARTLGLAAALLVPLGLLHAFVLGEIAVATVDILFLAHSTATRDFRWLRQPWLIAALIWWAWLCLCSLPIPALGLTTAGWAESFTQAAVILRLILFAAALQSWLLTTPAARRAIYLALALSCLWIGLESWQQYLTGHNIFGNHRWGDGSLTGPFWKPRAGAPYAHLLFTALLPPAIALITRKHLTARLTGATLAILAVVTSVLIGQRMSTALTMLGLLTAAIFIPQLRRIAAIAIAAAILVVLATPIISPPTYAKLVGETARNLSHFALSPYGQLYTRATVMGLQSPWHGWGFNGFRAFCPQPRFTSAIPALHLAPTQLALGACNLHPHNFYAQALTDSGFPGLTLFTAFALTCLTTLARHLWRAPAPLRVGTFIGLLTFLWPLASTDSIAAFYISGWLFLLLGLGLSLAHLPPNPTGSPHHV